ncbi:N-acetylmuramoyl-L-alanine amidase [Weissella soli]|uniref:N-acetylmuramoyl-L-alanine amidase n=1 Tax=Weissella soli TaxID=155866 RepID=UPI0035A12904
MKRLIQIMWQWVMHFWVPLAITVGMLSVAISFTIVLLVKQQSTVQIPNITIRTGAGIKYAEVGVLKRGEHLNILKRSHGWVQVRREDETTGWAPSWLLNRKTPVKYMGSLSEATVVLDPGHGGSDSGALSIDQKHFEKNYTLQLAQRVKTVLEKDYGTHVIMTRSTDQIVYLSKIPKIAEQKQADLFISFHFDSVPENNEASGYTAYYYNAGNGSKSLAQNINNVMKPAMPITNKGVEVGDFWVIHHNTVPAVLLENGYINSAKDFSYIRSAKYHKYIAKKVPMGLQNYLTQAAKSNQ